MQFQIINIRKSTRLNWTNSSAYFIWWFNNYLLL